MIAQLVAVGCALLGYAVMVMVCAPLLVAERRWTSRAPRRAILLWVGALGSGAVAMLVSLVCATWAASLLGAQPRRDLTVHAVAAGLSLTFAACALVAVVGGLVSVAIYQAVSTLIDRRTLYAGLGSASNKAAARRAPVRFVDSDEPVALSMPGRTPVIVVSTRLRDELSPAQLAAVVEHERGHLIQRHHRLVQLADLQHRCAPVLRCARSMDRSVHVLVELAADDHAARRCGRSAVAGALQTLSVLTGDASLGIRAARLGAR